MARNLSGPRRGVRSQLRRALTSATLHGGPRHIRRVSVSDEMTATVSNTDKQREWPPGKGGALVRRPAQEAKPGGRAMSGWPPERQSRTPGRAGPHGRASDLGIPGHARLVSGLIHERDSSPGRSRSG